MRTEEPRLVRLQDHRPPDWLVETVHLDVALHATATRVKARLELKPNPAAERGSGALAPLLLDGEGLRLSSLEIDGVALPAEQYAVTADHLRIAQPPPRAFVLAIETIVDPSANTELSGLYRSGQIYCTQCEAEGFRRITYFPDRPDVMAVYTTRIEADAAEAPVLLANGNLVESGKIPGSGRHYAVWHDPFPKPSYLFALVGGDLACVRDRFRTMSGRHVDLRIYVEHGNEQLTGHAMASLKRAMRWDEVAYGREYDLDVFMIVAVADFNMGAMENKGLNIFNDKYILASPATATDADFDRIEAVVAHEYFHNWTGNRITCRDWFQLCLKEGLTVFRDQEFTAETRSRTVERIRAVRVLRALQFVEDAGPLAHPVRPAAYREINNFYTTTVYEKGAEVVRMLKTMLGAELFRKGMDLYFARHDGQAATVEQFMQCFADVSGRDFSQFMLWYSQAGTPELVASGTHDALTRTYRLELAQRVPPTPGQADKAPMVIPLALGLVGSDGRDLPLTLAHGRSPGERSDTRDRTHTAVIILDQPAETFVLEGIDEPPIASINRGFSSPIKLAAGLSAGQLTFLAAHDGDGFNRWEALQTLAMRALLDAIARLHASGYNQFDQTLLATFAAILRDAALEPAFVALLLTLPSEADIARELNCDVDPDAVFAARRALQAALGGHLAGALEEHYRRLGQVGGYRYDPKSVGARALRNTCLELMVATGRAETIALAVEQYRAADNMTDRMAALAALALCDVPARAAVLDDFYARYARDPLIVDKWLTVQATIPEPATLARVKALTAHPAFSFTNPNRVRALIGSFALANHKEFNRADGLGYAFLVDTVLALDRSNPQLAARLLAALKSWRTLEPGRRGHAQAALERVAAAPSLSRDTADIVHRALAPAA